MKPQTRHPRPTAVQAPNMVALVDQSLTVVTPDKWGRLHSIDVWRGIAALAVVAIHMPHEAPGGFREHPFYFLSLLMDYGYLGVPFFVVISGFCIHRKSALTRRQTGEYSLNWSQFWKRRFWRLYPTYLAAILFSLICATWLHQFGVKSKGTFSWDLITHLLMIHNLTDEYATGLRNGVFWSLGMEEQLYGLYFFLFVLMSRFSNRTALFVACAVTVLWRILVSFSLENTVDVGTFKLGTWYQWPFQFWLHWTLGAIAVDGSLGNMKMPRWSRSLWAAMALLLVGVLTNRIMLDFFLRTEPGSRILAWVDVDAPGTRLFGFLSELLFAVAFFCLINWGLKKEVCGRWSTWANRLFAPVGKMSYSLYLVHVPILYVLHTHFPFDSTPSGWVKRAIVYLPVVMVGSGVFFWGVERWFLGASSSRKTGPQSSVPPPMLISVDGGPQ